MTTAVGRGQAGRSARETTPLRPAITRTMLTVFVIGDVLGAGIYALVGEVAGKVGGAIWTSFLLAGILAAFTAAAYAELVTKYPRAAGAALYVNEAFKRPFVTFLVAFAVMCSGVASAATLATAFGGDYLSEFVTLPKLLVGAVFIGVLALILRRAPVDHEHWRAPTALPVLGAIACLGLIVQKAFDDAVIFAYAGGLIALGVVLWAVNRALTGPAEPVDPAALVD
jgi:amino acid transporter